jgi:hypothetical protein
MSAFLLVSYLIGKLGLRLGTNEFFWRITVIFFYDVGCVFHYVPHFPHVLATYGSGLQVFIAVEPIDS